MAILPSYNKYDLADDRMLAKPKKSRPKAKHFVDAEVLLSEVLVAASYYSEVLQEAVKAMEDNTVDDVYHLSLLNKEVASLITKIKKSGCIKTTE